MTKKLTQALEISRLKGIIKRADRVLNDSGLNLWWTYSPIYKRIHKILMEVDNK